MSSRSGGRRRASSFSTSSPGRHLVARNRALPARRPAPRSRPPPPRSGRPCRTSGRAFSRRIWLRQVLIVTRETQCRNGARPEYLCRFVTILMQLCWISPRRPSRTAGGSSTPVWRRAGTCSEKVEDRLFVALARPLHAGRGLGGGQFSAIHNHLQRGDPRCVRPVTNDSVAGAHSRIRSNPNRMNPFRSENCAWPRRCLLIAAGGLHQPALSPRHSRDRRGGPLHHRPGQRPLAPGRTARRSS